MKKMYKSEKGITLVTLVVTIVVLLILAGVNISLVVGQNGIISKAIDAKKKTEEDSTNTQGALNNLKGEMYEILGIQDRTGLKVGEYVNYSPDTTQTNYSLTDANSGYSSAQTIAKDSTLTWRILSINDDGSVDLISTVPTSGTVTFSGATGYNNGVYLMNDICEKLYSHGEIKARSINLEDIEEQMTDAGKTARDNYISNQINSLAPGTHIQSVDKINKTVTYTTARSYYPNLYAQEIGAGINTKTVKKDGLTSSNIASLSTTTPEYKQATSGLTVTLTEYSGSLTSFCNAQAVSVLTSSNVFWVASRYVSCYSSNAYFGLRGANSYLDGNDMFGSKGNAANDSTNRLRPVVSLASNIKVTPCTGINSATNMHQVTY